MRRFMASLLKGYIPNAARVSSRWLGCLKPVDALDRGLTGQWGQPNVISAPADESVRAYSPLDLAYTLAAWRTLAEICFGNAGVPG